MNKSELIKAMVTKSNAMVEEYNEKNADKQMKFVPTQKYMEVVLDAFMECVKDAVVARDEVRLVGFGTFGTKENAARVGRNPQTGLPMPIDASTSMKFKPSKVFKELLNV